MSVVSPRLAGWVSRSLLPALPLLLSGHLWSQSTNPLELLKRQTPPATGQINYGKDSLQFGEIRVPAGNGPFPVAILVHGGCWSAKLKDLPEAVTSFELLRPIASALADAGIASWNIEYRRLGNNGGGWPGTYQDLGRGTDLLRDIASRYHLDLSRTIAIGHSSGGQLAMWLIARSRLPKNSPLYTDSPLPLKGAVGSVANFGSRRLIRWIDANHAGQSIQRTSLLWRGDPFGRAMVSTISAGVRARG